MIANNIVYANETCNGLHKSSSATCPLAVCDRRQIVVFEHSSDTATVFSSLLLFVTVYLPI